LSQTATSWTTRHTRPDPIGNDSPMEVDLVVLTRDISPLRQDVLRGIERQEQVELQIHRVIGAPRPDDTCRLDTITRARNEGRRLGSARWLMYLDDDVVMAPDCVARLALALHGRPAFAALGADCAGEMRPGWENWDYPLHVGMAATLFRREQLEELSFRWEPGKCECQCCCDDLRRAGFGIGYLPGALAWHRPLARWNTPLPGGNAAIEAGEPPPALASGRPGRILAAFNRRDYQRFRSLFLKTLRSAGNRELVTAVVYGLNRGERTLLAAEPGVEVVALADNGVCPALRRLRDFDEIVAGWALDTPVAYYDAGDVFFQGRLEPLWRQVRADPERLLVSAEPLSYPENPVIKTWSDHILDPAARRRAFEIMSSHVFLNSGFAAGTPRSLSRYLRAGDGLLNSTALRGVGDWGDQPALNLFCHNHPQAWKAISRAWNYALAGRDPRDYRIGRNGRIELSSGHPVHVVHGNAGSFRWNEVFWSCMMRGGHPAMPDRLPQPSNSAVRNAATRSHSRAAFWKSTSMG
jgi:hypothetical protein